MANLKEVKGRIQSVTSTQQITKAMKMVAAAKLRRAQDRIVQMRPYSQKLSGIISNLGVDMGEVQNPFAESREVQKVLLVVVTSDRGLCGAFNSSIFKSTRALIDAKYADVERAGNLTILPIGKKSYEFYKKRGYHVIGDFHLLFGHLDFVHASEAALFVLNSFVKGEYDHVDIIYNEFKNVATQIVRNEQFLPIEPSKSDDTGSSNRDYLFEPSKAFLYEEIIPKSLKIQFYKTLLESNASEQGARMTAMGKATDNAGELLKELKLTYNRTRQAAITKEILEIVGGAEALSQG